MTFLKAIIAALVAAAGSVGAAATDGHVSLAEWCVVIGATAVAFGGVYGVTNAPAKSAPPTA